MSKPRLIKYRAWDVTEKRMWWNVQAAYDTLGIHHVPDPDKAGHTAGIDDTFLPASFGTVLSDDRYVVEQFTGIYDGGGVEIYEGDILVESRSDEPFVVRWGDCAFNVALSCIDDGGGDCAPEILVLRYTRVGNIHENPELLSKKRGVR